MRASQVSISWPTCCGASTPRERSRRRCDHTLWGVKTLPQRLTCDVLSQLAFFLPRSQLPAQGPVIRRRVHAGSIAGTSTVTLTISPGCAPVKYLPGYTVRPEATLKSGHHRSTPLPGNERTRRGHQHPAVRYAHHRRNDDTSPASSGLGHHQGLRTVTTSLANSCRRSALMFAPCLLVCRGLTW
jgi:hypothetical protein